ncbi:serine hydrolase [Geothrix sp. PMB-07]|uniref:serine hydrolase n=1 Tax=Geothrix sp. PMB-07 TaxID=3068640 RepID=UPI0027405DCB|nr:serine hydrolase [Geothrix sp. PMB-07]WLT31005.1 serine hydrolase [Geothrix sp. PMB-07]
MRWLPRLFLSAVAAVAMAQTSAPEVAARLKPLDAYMAKVMKDFNSPGIGIAVVSGDQLVFAKGYGYRDYGKKLPFTSKTLFQIASNSKLFTAVSAGMLVEEGKLSWDQPIKESVPSIRFYDENLNARVTLRDMLAHRTGITRHDTIWYKSPDSRALLFQKLQYMEPKEPMRQLFLYNNMMYAAVGQVIELKSGKTWEEFVRQRIFQPLEMNQSLYSVADMVKQPDFGVGFTEKRDSFELYQAPYYEDTAGMAPCGAIISSLEDMSHWLAALMNDGKYKGQQVLPSAVLKATLEPAIGLSNPNPESRGWWEVLNPAYGMAREMATYCGHLLTFHGGDLPGFHSQVSFMPKEKLGVIVFVLGNHDAMLYNPISYNVYEFLLGLDQTPWPARMLDIRLKGKKEGTASRAKAGADQVKGTHPSHPLDDFTGEFEHPAYGILTIGKVGDQLQFDFHKMKFALSHFHYDRFDTADDEEDGKWSVNFQTSPQGDVDRAVMSLDESEATFVRRAPALDPAMAGKLVGTYETATGYKVQVQFKEGAGLAIVAPGQPQTKLLPYRGLKFRSPEFSDLIFEFVLVNGQVTSLKQIDPSGESLLTRK